MIFHWITIGFTAYFLGLVQQQPKPVELVPVDQSIEDRGALSSSLWVVPLDMRQDHTFEKLYRVVGSKDVYVRKAGALRAVFRNPVYVDTPEGSIAIVPAGTVYCIGEVTPRILRQLGVLTGTLPEPVETGSVGSQEFEEPPPIVRNFLYTSTIRFVDDEAYRRQRLASFVLDVVLSY